MLTFRELEKIKSEIQNFTGRPSTLTPEEIGVFEGSYAVIVAYVGHSFRSVCLKLVCSCVFRITSDM